MIPFADYCRQVEQRMEPAYGVRVITRDIPDPLTGDLNGEEIHIDCAVTAEQRLFLGFAQIWCENHTDESARMAAQVDPHSPGEFRVNGVVSNMPEFQQAFACKIGQPMVRRPACRVW